MSDPVASFVLSHPVVIDLKFFEKFNTLELYRDIHTKIWDDLYENYAYQTKNHFKPNNRALPIIAHDLLGNKEWYEIDNIYRMEREFWEKEMN
tara:strand:+ start:76 stop:354 length:279 start_codon:yes stop_codon:yes gene_type:complete